MIIRVHPYGPLEADLITDALDLHFAGSLSYVAQ